MKRPPGSPQDDQPLRKRVNTRYKSRPIIDSQPTTQYFISSISTLSPPSTTMQARNSDNITMSRALFQCDLVRLGAVQDLVRFVNNAIALAVDKAFEHGNAEDSYQLRVLIDMGRDEEEDEKQEKEQEGEEEEEGGAKGKTERERGLRAYSPPDSLDSQLQLLVPIYISRCLDASRHWSPAKHNSMFGCDCDWTKLFYLQDSTDGTTPRQTVQQLPYQHIGTFELPITLCSKYITVLSMESAMQDLVVDPEVAAHLIVRFTK
ncbi:hypothetical protein KCU65_g2622, partial [Aureobasidium melanogenum]